MYKVRDLHGVLATPWGCWNEGEAFVPPPTLPREILRNWMEKGVIVTDEAGPDVEELLDEVDVLTTMDRKQLRTVISTNKQQLGTVKPRQSWTDDVIRQAIRDIAEVSTLTISAAEAPASL